MVVRSTDGFEFAGVVTCAELNLFPKMLPAGRTRHRYGDGPFARLKMPDVPDSPGVYLWDLDGQIVYVGETRSSLKQRLGSRGYSTISNYNTFKKQPGRSNPGQETNCRINSLANDALSSGHKISIWYRSTSKEFAQSLEAQWKSTYGLPIWNRQ